MRRLSVFLLALLVSVPAWSRVSVPEPLAGAETVRMQLAMRNLSPGEAAARARSVYPGRVLSIKRVRSGGRIYYKVKILTGRGAVRVVFVDAQTGAVQ